MELQKLYKETAMVSTLLVSFSRRRKSNNRMIVRLRVWKIAFSIEYPSRRAGSPPLLG
jgi:hypothetical protein